MKKSKGFLLRPLALLLLLGFVFLPSSGRSATLTADAGQTVSVMSQTLYGLFFEDINHAADGGLYAELLGNRSFENRSFPEGRQYDAYAGWMFNYRMAGTGKAIRMTGNPLHANNPVYMRLEISSGTYQAVNFGYPISPGKAGIPLDEGLRYKGSVFLRGQGFKGEITAVLTDVSGRPLSNRAQLRFSEEWGKQTFELTASETADAVLCFTFSGTGALDMDMASLIPANAYGADWQNGGLRADLVQAMIALQPRFIRFPGGCVAEGSYYRSNIYRWKDTIGPVEERKENENTWGYMQSYGLGFHEYFQLCEDLDAKPLPVVSAALVCQVRGSRDIPVIGEELKSYIQDVLDLVEYANGSADTVWGAKRAQNGHPEPFGLEYLAIGNENWGSDYFYRYKVISEAVKESWPDITCIVASGPVAEGPLIEDSWAAIRRQFAHELVDEHYYMDSGWFMKNTHRYDAYSREGNSVFLGEYAAHEPVRGGRRPNNLFSALCEAAYLTGIERNSDIVRMSCYAPLMAREGMQQWTPDLIWFDARTVLLTPNYYVQKMFASTLGEEVVESQLDAQGLFHVVTRTRDTLYIKLVNPGQDEMPIIINIKGLQDAQGTALLLTGTPGQVNTFQNPDALRPVESACRIKGGRLESTLPAWSVTIYSFPID